MGNLSEKVIFTAARQLLAQYDDPERAGKYASTQLERQLQRGDMQGYATWKRIAEAIHQLTDISPSGHVLH